MIILRGSGEIGTTGWVILEGKEYVRVDDGWYYAPPGNLVLIDTRTDKRVVVKDASRDTLTDSYRRIENHEADIATELRRLGKQLGDKPAVEFIEKMISETTGGENRFSPRSI